MKEKYKPKESNIVKLVKYLNKINNEKNKK
jgi:hypothetical protein